jgi:2-desacetyl-2-hydroxyethyl bacteriochlorophyllide A dehydrogenase
LWTSGIHFNAMKAAVLHGPRSLRVQAAPAPAPAAGEVLVRVAIAGLCGTDYSIFSGERPVGYPRVMGHEFVGRVEAVGPGVTAPRAGDRVAIEPNYSCGACPLCREGNRNLCLRRTAIGIDVDGCFAELVRVPARCCWPAPSGVADEDLMVTEPLAVVVRAVARGQVRSGEATAVVGAGTLGLLAVQVLRAHGARVLAVSRSGRRLRLAEELGAEATHASAEGRALDDVAREFSHREGVDCVVETAGTAQAAADALTLVRPGGRVVLTGLPHDPTPVRFFSVVRREISIVGSMIYQDEFTEAMQLVATGRVKTRPLVTHRFALDEIERAFAMHREPAAIKVAVTP